MAIKIGQEFERTSKATRFKDDVMTKAQMLACTDDNYSDGYLVVEKDSHDLYIYDSNATPSQETGKFVKVETGSSNLPMTKTVLWELPQGAVINPDNITLSNPMSDYEQILIEGFVSSDGKDHIMSCLLIAEDLHTTNAVGLSDQEMRYVWYNVNSQTSLSKRIANGGILIYRIYGITFGSSLDGTIGRWEKIGQWETDQTGLIIDLSKYNMVTLTGIFNKGSNNPHAINSVTLNINDIQTTGQLSLRSLPNSDTIATLTNTATNTWNLILTGTCQGAILYGYKETAISDADVQKIADATALKSTNMEALWNNGELKGMKLFKNDNDLRIFDDGQVLLIDGNTTTRVNLTTKNYVDTELAKKQDTLTAGTNITIDANNVISASGGGSLPSGGTTGQALVKKSDADQDVEWADQTVIVGSDWGVAKQGTVTVSGTTESTVSISDLNLTSASDYQVAITPSANTSNPSYINKSVASFTVKIADNSGNKTLYYTIFAKGYGSVPNGGTTGQALIKKSNTDGDVEWKTVSGGGASLTIDTTQVGYGEATISEGGQNLSFTNQNGQGVHIGGISENGEMVASKTYVDSKSPTIVNEGATFTNAQGNQQMEIRTGGTNSVIIKDKSANGVSEYWSYELPDKPYVDTEVAKRNAVVNFDNEYKTLQIRDVNDSVEFQVVKETSNDYVRVNEYAKDDRGQMQQIFDVNLPTKTYVDNEILSQEKTIGNEYYYTSRTPGGYKLFKENQTSNAVTALSLNSNQIALTHNSGSGAPVEDLTINTQENGACSVQMSDNMISAFNSTLGAGINMKIDAEKWYGTYTDENNVTYQVYTKTIYIPALPATAGITTYQHGISGIKQILSVYGFTTDGFVLNAPRQTTSDNIAIYQVQKSATGGIAIEVGKDRSSKKAYVTLIYAKNN